MHRWFVSGNGVGIHYAHAQNFIFVSRKSTPCIAETMATNTTRAGYYRIELGTVEWEIRETYQELSPLGIGAFGTVWCVGTSRSTRLAMAIISAIIASMFFSSAENAITKQKVAVKKLSRPFQSVIHAKRCYRELKLLRHISHDNVS